MQPVDSDSRTPVSTVLSVTLTQTHEETGVQRVEGGSSISVLSSHTQYSHGSGPDVLDRRKIALFLTLEFECVKKTH